MSIVVRVWKWRSFSQSTRSSKWRKNRECRRCRGSGRPPSRDDQQVFGQRHLSLSQDRIGGGQDFLGPSDLGVGDVAFARDREQERVDTRCIHCVNGVDAREDGRDQRPRGSSWIKALNEVSSWGGGLPK